MPYHESIGYAHGLNGVKCSSCTLVHLSLKYHAIDGPSYVIKHDAKTQHGKCQETSSGLSSRLEPKSSFIGKLSSDWSSGGIWMLERYTNYKIKPFSSTHHGKIVSSSKTGLVGASL